MSILSIAKRAALYRSASLLIAALSAVALSPPASAGPAFRKTDVLELPNAAYFPESVTSDEDGTLYASSIPLGAIYRFPAHSTQAEPFVPVGARTGIAGLAFDKKRHVLWACIVDLTAGAFSSRLEAFDPDTATLSASYPLPGQALCADIAVAGATTLYVTDTNASSSRIYKLSTPHGSAVGGVLSAWASDPLFTEPVPNAPPLGLNGIAYDPAFRAVYVGKYNSGQLFRVPVRSDGSAGKPVEVDLGQRFPFIDGIRLLLPGTVLAAVNTGPVVAITVAGQRGLANVVGQFDQPSSLAISRGGIWVAEGQILRLQGADPTPPNLPFKLRRLASGLADD